MDISTSSARSSAPGSWRNRDFVKLWIGQTASHLAAQGSQVILPLIAVIALGAGTHQLGALRAAQQAPVLLFSLLAGVWADRRQARDLMVLADLGRLLVLAAVPVAYLLGALDLPVLVVVAFLAGICTVCFDVAYQAALPRLVERDRLAQGNSLLESSRSAAQIAGPAVGGGLMSLLSGPVAVAVAASLFALSSVSIGRIRRRESVSGRAGRASSAPGQIRDGIRFVARDSLLRAMGLAACVYQFCFAALMTTYLFFLPHTLRLSGTATGIALAALGPGTLIGSLLAARLVRWLGYGPVLVGAAAVADGAMLCVPGLHGAGAGTVCLLVLVNVVFGTFGQTVDIATMAVRQAVTPAQLQGRVTATMHAAGVGLAPLGSLVGGYLAGAVGPRTGLLLAGVGLLLSPLCMALSPLRRVGRRLP